MGNLTGMSIGTCDGSVVLRKDQLSMIVHFDTALGNLSFKSALSSLSHFCTTALLWQAASLHCFVLECSHQVWGTRCKAMPTAASLVPQLPQLRPPPGKPCGAPPPPGPATLVSLSLSGAVCALKRVGDRQPLLLLAC